MTGNAIQQIEEQQIHPQYPFKMVKQYCDEFTREYLEKYKTLEEDKKFEYLYFERLTEYDGGWGADQLYDMKAGLEEQIIDGIQSNREQAITWVPYGCIEDVHSKSPPCLQRIWMRYGGDNAVDVHMDWRSRDLYNAWQSNIIALCGMLNREVVRPNGCEIARIVDYSDSLHIYKADIEAAKKVEPARRAWLR
jgi:thymidylate synthase